MLVPALFFCLIVNAQCGYKSPAVYDTEEECPESRRCPEGEELGYMESDLNFNTIKEFIIEHTQLSETATQAERSYGALILTLIVMGQAMTDGLSYDEAYAQWPGIVVIGKEFPISTREMIYTKVSESSQGTQSIRDLIKQCGSKDSQNCNCEIEDAIKNDPKLQAEGKILIQIGHIAVFWLQNRYIWLEAGQSDNVEQYLDCNKEELRSATEQMSALFKMYKNNNNNCFTE